MNQTSKFSYAESMAVLIEATSVVVRSEALLQKFPDGWEAFKRVVIPSGRD